MTKQVTINRESYSVVSDNTFEFIRTRIMESYVYATNKSREGLTTLNDVMDSIGVSKITIMVDYFFQEDEIDLIEAVQRIKLLDEKQIEEFNVLFMMDVIRILNRHNVFYSLQDSYGTEHLYNMPHISVW